MITKKRTFKALRLIICLAIIVSASSLFLTIEPMASESSEQLPILQQEEKVVVQPQTFQARSPYTPVMPLRAALLLGDASQTVEAADLEAALLDLPEEQPEEILAEETIEVVETIVEEVYEEESYYEEEVYEEESDYEDSYYEEESQESYVPSTPSVPDTPSVEEPEDTTTEDSSSNTGSYSDLDYLAAICQIEAGYNYDGCLAVANVILNRLNNGGFGGSIRDVIYQPYQFATGWMDYYLQNGTSSTARDAAAAALAGSNNIGGYLHFNGTAWINPDTLGVPYVIIGGNCFY